MQPTPPSHFYTTTWQRVLQSIVAWCLDRRATWHEERRRRVAWNALQCLSDATLRDIGIGRSEVGRFMVPPVVDDAPADPLRETDPTPVPARRSLRPASPVRDAL